MSSALRGRRIVITRTREQSGELRVRLETLGAEVISVPMIAIVPPESYAPLDSALVHAREYEWLVLTSANAVRVFRERMAYLELAPSVFSHIRIAAIGPSTAAALQDFGLTVAAVPAQYNGDDLARMLGPQAGGQRVLIVRASVARDVVPDALRRAGADVSIVDAYRTVVPESSRERLREALASARQPDAILFASSSAVQHFVALTREERPMGADGLRAVSIGPATSATLRELGWPAAAEAATATVEGLVEACVRLFSGR